MTRIASGVTDQGFYFVAVDATDFTTRETGLSTWTVYRERNNGTAAAMTTPTITEVDATNLPGVYFLLCDEDMTIDSGDETQEMVYHITHSGMAPVTKVVELFRPKITAGETLTVSSGVGSANTTQWNGSAVATPTVAGVPEVDVTHWLGTAQTEQLETAASFGRLIETTIATLASQTSFTLTAGSADDDAYNGRAIVIEDASTNTQVAVGTVSDYTGSTRTVTLSADPGIFTMAVGDTVRIFAYVASSTGGSGATAQEVWEYATRTLTAIDEDSTTLDIDAAVRAAVGMTAADLDTQLAALPTAAENADAVWDEDATAHQTQGTFGQAIGDPGADTDSIWALANTNLDATVSSRLASASYTAPLDAAGVRTAVGLASANLDTQLSTIDGNVDSILDDTGTSGVEIAAGALDAAALSTDAAQEIRDAITAATLSELTGDPGATPSLSGAVMLLYMAIRNLRETTATTDTIHNNAGTAILEATVSDDGTTFSKGEYAAPAP